MTFADEGNKTFLEKGLVNFEKMVMLVNDKELYSLITVAPQQMISLNLRTLRYCRSRPFSALESLATASSAPIKKASAPRVEAYIRDLKVIDNQRLLTQYSYAIEKKS